MFTNKKQVLVLASLLLSLAAWSQESAPTPMSLAAAKEYAVQHAFQVKNTDFSAQVAKLQTQELIAMGLPQANGSIQYQNFIDRPTSILPGDFFGQPGKQIAVQFGVPQQMTVGLSASQLLFDGSWLIGLQASKSYAAMQQKQVQKSQIDVKRSTEEAYHLAVIADESLALLTSAREVLQSSLENTKALSKEGFVESQDVDQLQLSLNELNNRIRTAEMQRGIALDLLKFTIGMPIENSISLTDNSQVVLDSFNSMLLQNTFNPDVLIDNLITKDAIALQKLNVKNQQARLLPNAAAFYNLQRQALRQEFNFFNSSQSWYPTQIWGLSINVPLLSGGAKMRGIQKAGVEVKRMEETLAYSTNASKLEYKSAMAEYVNASQSVSLAMQSYDLANSILMKTQIKFDAGTVSSFELSRQTSQLIQAQVTLLQARLSLMNAQTRLSKSFNAL